MLKRTLNLHNLLKKKSFFLFGPRETGKSSLIDMEFGGHELPNINLLHSDFYMRLSDRPSALEDMINAYPNPELVIIDEIQMIPALLNEVHRLIESRGLKFLLTGSSARKLRRQNVNLLGGRAWEAQLYPLTSKEIPDFNLERYLQYGGLPPVYLGEEPFEELMAYVNTYLKEEIQMESLVRRIPAFSRFLKTAALMSGHVLNFTAIASDSAVPASTIREYYQILEDTFLGFMLPAWTKSTRRKAMSTAKFYLFDIGVRNTLAGITAISPHSNLYGDAFEHFIAMELRAYISYRRLFLPLQYWRSHSGSEVDFIVGDEYAIEVKSTDRVKDKHLVGLKALQEEQKIKQFYMVSNDPISVSRDGIHMLPWQKFVSLLWQDKLIKR